MGNPNRDLFIKTISWLFVVPASRKEATSQPDIITSSLGFQSLSCSLIQILHSSIYLNTRLSLLQDAPCDSQPPAIFYPTFPLFLYLQLSVSLPLPTPFYHEFIHTQ